MGLSEFGFRVLLIFIPGLVAHKVVDELTTHRETKPHILLLNALLLGFVCYLEYGMLTLFRIPGLSFNLFEVLQNRDAKLDFVEICIVTLAAIPTGLLVAAIVNRKLLGRLAHRWGVSRRFSYLDVWGHLMDWHGSAWVNVRDHSTDLCYEGWIEFYSDSADNFEVYLREVRVFRNSTAERLYEVPSIYLARDARQLEIEFLSAEDEPVKREEQGGHGHG